MPMRLWNSRSGEATTTTGGQHNHAVDHGGCLGVSLGGGSGPDRVHHGEHGVGSIFVDLVADGGGQPLGVAILWLVGNTMVRLLRTIGTKVTYARAGINTFVGVGADVLIQTR